MAPVAKKEAPAAKKAVTKKVHAAKKGDPKPAMSEQKKARIAKVRAMMKEAKTPAVKRALAKSIRPKKPLSKKQRPNNVSKVKAEIHAIKRAGGTISYAKNLRRIRRAKHSHVLHQTKKRLASDRKLINAYVKQEKGSTEKTDTKINLKKTCVYKPTKMRKLYHTQLPMRKLPHSNTFKDQNPRGRRHYAKLRKSLTPGTVVIMVGTHHQCKKAVFLKQLKRSGLCLVSGPWYLNGVPVRRIDQRFLIATSIKLNLNPKFKVPACVDDSFFKKPRIVKKKVKQGEDATFKTKKVTVKRRPNPARAYVQKYVDTELMNAIRKHKETGPLKKYLKQDFGLMGRRYAHHLKF